MRSGAVSCELFQHNVAPNGVVLVSLFMDFGAGGWNPMTINSDVNFLTTTYAATAWYHKAIANRPAERSLPARSGKVCPRGLCHDVIERPPRHPGRAASHAGGPGQIHRHQCGLPDKSNLRMSEGRFLQELLRNKGEVGGCGIHATPAISIRFLSA